MNKSEAGRTLSALGASKGGVARANKLTPDERRAIATRAAHQRWGSGPRDGAGSGEPCAECARLTIVAGELRTKLLVAEDRIAELECSAGLLDAVGVRPGPEAAEGVPTPTTRVRGARQRAGAVSASRQTSPVATQPWVCSKHGDRYCHIGRCEAERAAYHARLGAS